DQTVPAPPAPYDEPFAYLAAVVRGTAPEDVLSSLATNMLVVEILDAAKQSVKEGKTGMQPFVGEPAHSDVRPAQLPFLFPAQLPI
nr:hypothetical protein [Tanacetum cinerariifolium]